jgi:hypothetical protein
MIRLGKPILLAAVGGILAYSIGEEMLMAPRSMKAPPGATLVTFRDLAGIRLPDPGGHPGPGDYWKGVPQAVRSLDQQRVAIQGFMIPTRTDPKGVEAFLLVRSQASCCFGLPPSVTDVLEVRMVGQPAEPLRDRVVDVVGRLHVQEHWAGPMLGSLFQVDAERVTSASPLGAPLPVRPPQAPGLE